MNLVTVLQQAVAFARRHKWKILSGHGVAAALAGAVLWIAGVFSANPGLVTVLLHGAKPGQVITVTVPAKAVEQAQASPLEKGLHGEAPEGMSPAAIDKVQTQQDALAATDQLPIVTPAAAPEQAGCRTELVQDYSTRRGVRPRLFVLHYTVSANAAGWADVNAIVSIFNRLSFQASSNYVIDNEGHCAYIVRESDKAWTQAALNPVSISVEEINSGHEASYAAAAGLAKIAHVASDSMCRWEIPVQLGDVANGVVTRPGLVDHAMLGIAGGGHHDITPYKVAPVLAAIEKYRAAHPCATDKKPAPKPAPKPKPAPRCTVKQLQTALNAHRVRPRLAVDGVEGPKTKAALKRIRFGHLGLRCRL